MLAREFGQKSRLGAYLNELTDVVADAALYLPFALLAPFAPGWVATVIVLAVISEFAGVLGPMVGASRRYDGPMGKSDRAFVFGALGLWVGLAGALPAVDRVADADRRRAARRHDRQPRAARPRGRRGDDAMNDTVAVARVDATCARAQLSHARRRRPLLSPLAAPTASRARGAIVLFHRGHEHGGRMAHLVDELDLPDFDFFAWDARGHGRSPGARGDAPSISALGARRADTSSTTSRRARLRDRGHCRRRAKRRRGAGRRVGARLRAAHPLHGRSPRRRSRSSSTCRSRVPASPLMHKLRGNFFVNSYVKAKFLTHDPERIASYDTDPLITRPISVRLLLGLYEAAERVVADAQAIVVPTQLLISGADWVVHHAPQHAVLRAPRHRRSRSGTSCRLLSRHAGRARPRTGRRARARVPAAPVRRAARDAGPARRRHAHGVTREEADALAAPLPPLSPRGLYWSPTRAGLRLGGALSDGVRARPCDRIRLGQHARLRLPQRRRAASRRSDG